MALTQAPQGSARPEEKPWHRGTREEFYQVGRFCGGQERKLGLGGFRGDQRAEEKMLGR